MNSPPNPTPHPTRVVFDLYGTLVSSQDSPEAGQSWRDTVQSLLEVEPAPFVEAFSHLTPQRERGDLTYVDATLAAVTEAGGQVSLKVAEEFLRVSAELLVPHFNDTLRPGVLPALRALRDAGIDTYLLSNASDDTALALNQWDAAGVFNQVHVSSRLGHAKPNPGAYWACGARPGDVFVGDGGSSELVGARAAGLRAIQIAELHFDRSTSYRPGWDGEQIPDLQSLIPALLG